MARELVTDLSEAVDADCRYAVVYDGDEYERVVLREDVANAFTDEEFDQHVNNS